MTKEQLQQFREATQLVANVTRAQAGARRIAPTDSWELQTSNSFRRIGLYGDGDILCAVTQRPDGHPDLQAPPGVLEYIVMVQPSRILELLDDLSRMEMLAFEAVKVLTRMREAVELPIDELIELREAVDKMIEVRRGNL